jgi:hypothetical protein
MAANPAPIVAPIFATPIPAAACNKIVDNIVFNFKLVTLII